MSTSREQQQKSQRLRTHGCLNPRPEAVRDELFTADAFFDPRDLLQVKYEMLRRVRLEKRTVSKAADDFGVSRVSFYQAQEAFDSEGLAGLLPRKRGPKGRHKLSREVMRFVEEVRGQEGRHTPDYLARRIKAHFGIRVHPRSIQRALAAEKKKLPARQSGRRQIG